MLEKHVAAVVERRARPTAIELSVGVEPACPERSRFGYTHCTDQSDPGNEDAESPQFGFSLEKRNERKAHVYADHSAEHPVRYILAGV